MHLGRKTFLLTALVCLVGSVTLAGDTFYVDGSCTTEGDGETDDCDDPDGHQPFKTIQKALDDANLSRGGTIRIKDSVTYTESTITSTAAGSSSAPITLTKYAAEDEPLITGTLNLNHDWWVVSDLKFGGTSTDRAITVDAANIEITRSEFTGRDADNILVTEDGDNLTVRNCNFHDTGGGGQRHAIKVGNNMEPESYVVTGLSIKYNTFDNIGGDGIQLFELSDKTQGVNTIAGRMMVEGNLFEGYNDLNDDGSKAVVIQHCSDHVDFTGNIIDSTGGDCDLSNGQCIGLVVSASTQVPGTDNPVEDIRIRSNLFFGMHTGVQLAQTEGGITTELENVEVYNNTFADSSFALSFRGVFDGLIKNNLMDVTKSVDCKDDADLSAMSSGDADYNGFFGGTENVCDESDCVDALCGDNDVNDTDPGFFDEANNNFTLSTSSACIDEGVDVGLPYNYTYPDLGAYETLLSGGPNPVPEWDCPMGHQICEFAVGW